MDPDLQASSIASLAFNSIKLFRVDISLKNPLRKRWRNGGQAIRGEGLKENEKGGESPGAREELRRGRKTWMINDASTKWRKKYGRCLVCIAEETQRQRYMPPSLTPRRGSTLTAKLPVLMGPLPQPSSLPSSSSASYLTYCRVTHKKSRWALKRSCRSNLTKLHLPLIDLCTSVLIFTKKKRKKKDSITISAPVFLWNGWLEMIWRCTLDILT